MKELQYVNGSTSGDNRQLLFQCKMIINKMNLSCWTRPVEFFKSLGNHLLACWICFAFLFMVHVDGENSCAYIKLNFPSFLIKIETFTL